MTQTWRRPQDEVESDKECANCGDIGDLLRCSRCHSEYFCSLKCHKAYWPFHRQYCKKNEFADAIEQLEPKFARWMRSHGKLAVLKDDEVERLERAGRAAAPPMSRQEVMDSMYGRLEPKPREPSFTPEETAKMEALEYHRQEQALLLSPQEQLWQELTVPADMGVECTHYKWRQNQSRVEVYAKLPQGCGSHQVDVLLRRRYLRVVVGGQQLLSGALWADIQLDDSYWTIDDGVLEVSLLKFSRRGHYAAGHCNADTFWRSVLMEGPPEEALQLEHAPTRYYWTDLDPEDMVASRNAAAALPGPAAGRNGLPGASEAC